MLRPWSFILVVLKSRISGSSQHSFWVSCVLLLRIVVNLEANNDGGNFSFPILKGCIVYLCFLQPDISRCLSERKGLEKTQMTFKAQKVCYCSCFYVDGHVVNVVISFLSFSFPGLCN